MHNPTVRCQLIRTATRRHVVAFALAGTQLMAGGCGGSNVTAPGGYPAIARDARGAPISASADVWLTPTGIGADPGCPTRLVVTIVLVAADGNLPTLTASRIEVWRKGQLMLDASAAQADIREGADRSLELVLGNDCHSGLAARDEAQAALAFFAGSDPVEQVLISPTVIVGFAE